MNNKFENPELTIIQFVDDDIILTSATPGSSNPGGFDDDPDLND